MNSNISGDVLKLTLAQIADTVAKERNSSILQSADQRPQSVIKIVLTAGLLGVEANQSSPFQVGFPFRSVYVSDATNSNTTVRLGAHSREINHLENPIPLKINDSIIFDRYVSKAFLMWDAQPGETITLLFFSDAEFRSGSLRSVSAGGVSVTWGDTVSPSDVTLPAATATQLLAVNSNRKYALVQNDTGSDMFIYPTNLVTGVPPTRGIRVASGGIFEWQSSSALYGIIAGGGTISVQDFQ